MVADSLKTLPCKAECIRRILHYLERVSRGEPNEEDRTVFLPSSEVLRGDQVKQQQELYDSLDSVLRRQPTETLAMLAHVYGLGSDDPSAFAFSMVRRLRIHEACAYLLESQKRIKQRSSNFYDPPKEIESTLVSLECR